MVVDHPIRDVFARHYAWQLWQPLDEDLMQEAARGLVGEHDFKSYETAGSPRANTVRSVIDLTVQRQRFDLGERIVIEVEANGFLYNMVRNIVGTLIEVGRAKQPIGWPVNVLAAKDRRLAGATAPPQGLYLLNVNFGG